MIHSIIDQLNKKRGCRTVEELEALQILRSFLAAGSVPKLAKQMKNKDGDLDEDKSDR